MNLESIMREERYKVAIRSIPIMGKTLCALYLSLTFLHPFFLRDDIKWPMTYLALSSSVCCLGSLMYYYRNRNFSHAIVIIYQILYIFLCGLNSFVHMIMSREIQQTTNILFIFFVMTTIGLGQKLFFILLGLIDCIWIIVILSIPHSPPSSLVHFAFAMAIGTMIAAVLFFGRNSMFKKSVYEIQQRLISQEALKQANARLQEMTLVDPLTGVANRRHFEMFLSASWDRHLKSGEPITVMVCDVDHFKLFNDMYGHNEGDKVLALVADALKNCIRLSKDCVARIGGEEFVLIFPGMPGNDAEMVAERVCKTVRDKTTDPRRVTISVGVHTVVPSDTMNPEMAFEKADKALYRAKADGRNCFRVG